jgi:hypothetical protein
MFKFGDSSKGGTKGKCLLNSLQIEAKNRNFT